LHRIEHPQAEFSGSGANVSEDGMAYGGRITWVDFVMWPFVGLLPILAMVVPGPRWVAFALLAFAGLMGAGVGLTLSGVTDERSWVTGGRIQLPLILGAFVMAELTWFASAYWLTSQGTPSSFSAPLTCIDAIYFSLTTYTPQPVSAISLPAPKGRGHLSRLR
jgi:hypothetical protein